MSNDTPPFLDDYNNRSGFARRDHHKGSNLIEVLQTANRYFARGELEHFSPIPTGLKSLDGAVSGGLRKTELILLGGAQGVGKTITSLQVARNIAMQPDHYVYYLSYEHSEVHLLQRLLCLESVEHSSRISLRGGIRLRDIYRIISNNQENDKSLTELRPLWDILRDDPRVENSLRQIERYADRLVLLQARTQTHTLNFIREITRELRDKHRNVSLFIDYLQKVPVFPEKPLNEDDKVTIIAEGLKDIAMTYDVPVWAIVAASREGLRSPRMHLYHLRGSSALDYEADIAMLMHNKYSIMNRQTMYDKKLQEGTLRNWVVFTIEKNRAGVAFQDIEFQLYAQHFALDPNGKESKSEDFIDGIAPSF